MEARPRARPSAALRRRHRLGLTLSTIEIDTEIDTEAVCSWGAAKLRDLPWRRVRDPWKVLVAEVMLHQTQVARVIPRWEAFCAAYPTPVTCAAAPLAEVLRAWHGLGYPRRARNLHATAGIVTTDHGGRLPDDLEDLLSLPGIGPYTARAVLAFAFERDVGVVDTNIARVLARLSGTTLTARQAQALADHLVPRGSGWLWNQTLMDLGATLCRPRPGCEACPVSTGCSWNVAGRPDPDPAVGSAGVSARQAPYAGSMREARGRVLDALVERPRGRDEFPVEVVDSLLADGLVHVEGPLLSLPGDPAIRRQSDVTAATTSSNTASA